MVGHLVFPLSVPPHLVSFSFEELDLVKLTGLAGLEGGRYLGWGFPVFLSLFCCLIAPLITGVLTFFVP